MPFADLNGDVGFATGAGILWTLQSAGRGNGYAESSVRRASYRCDDAVHARLLDETGATALR